MAIDTSAPSPVVEVGHWWHPEQPGVLGWGDTYGDTVSATNRSFIDEGACLRLLTRSGCGPSRSMGTSSVKTLVNHHLGRGPMAIPAQPVHGNASGFGIWHGF